MLASKLYRVNASIIIFVFVIVVAGGDSVVVEGGLLW